MVGPQWAVCKSKVVWGSVWGGQKEALAWSEVGFKTVWRRILGLG